MDLIGKKFNRLIAIEKTKRKYATYYKCICDCGNETMVYRGNLKSGKVKSCGCLMKEFARNSFYNSFYKHGCSGYNETKEYTAWQNMKTRCYNENYHNYHRYGGRGIKVCDKWLNDFQAFLDDVGNAPGLEYSIDRIDNDGHYEPGNVRWADGFKQIHNRSISNHMIE